MFKFKLGKSKPKSVELCKTPKELVESSLFEKKLKKVLKPEDADYIKAIVENRLTGKKLTKLQENYLDWLEKNDELIKRFNGIITAIKYKTTKTWAQFAEKEELPHFDEDGVADATKVISWLRWNDLEQKENFDEEIYNERATHKNKKITTEDFESLKPLTTSYSYIMQWGVKIHKFNKASSYIVNYDKVGLIYGDMDLQEWSTEENPVKGERKFENIKNSYKMQEFAKKNRLDISNINFEKSLNTFLSIGQAVADAYGMLIKFNVDFLDKPDNDGQIERILYWILTIIWEEIHMPYKIDKDWYVSSCDVISGYAWSGRYYGNGYDDLSTLISCRSE